MLIVALIVATLFVAYSNGANDNFKGVATLFGSKTTPYNAAIRWATITTFTGSIVSIFLASQLIKNFSGKGLVPDAIADTLEFHLAVALAAGITVILATFIGFPISTTHGLTGALVGAGWIAIGPQLNLKALQQTFLLPLLLSPLVAMSLAALFYGILRYLRIYFGIEKEWCICAGTTQNIIPIPQPDASNILGYIQTTDVAIDSVENCTQRYIGEFLGITSQKLIDSCHFFSAGAVSFARGLNDSPKIVALMIVGQMISPQWGILAISIAMALGGLFNAQKVAKTMSQKITQMNAGQGVAANLVTGFLVIFASRFGMPVSTTHVSVGSIFGVGLLSKKANYKVFYQILLSWLLTLPIAAFLSGTTYWLLNLHKFS